MFFEDEPRKNTKTDGPTLLRRPHGMKPHPGARASRLHNTGKASPIASTGIDRQRRQDPALAEPMPFPPTGWPGAESQEN